MEPRPLRRKDVMTVPEAGARLGLSPKASYDAAERGTFPVIRNGRRKFVSVVAFEDWLKYAGRDPWQNARTPLREQPPGAPLQGEP